ncbi:MAG: 50S ribosomal protein L35 [Saprospiraceae bacterium]|nr:50S ribosomal protein L35 [Saprospiraceae bacterium]
MPKMKSHSGSKKRFSVTGSGKVKRGHANTSHRFWGKSAKAKLRHAGTTVVDASEESRIKRLLAVG